VGVIGIRFRLLVIGSFFMFGAYVLRASAEDKIQAFVNTNGKLVFTNLMQNTSTETPAIPETTNATAGGVSDTFKTLVDAISATYGVDPALVRAVIKAESNFNRFAVSRKGALGLMQLIPSTGRRYGVRDFFDPQQNIDGGVRYLKFLLEKFKGNLDLSLAAYNAGENLVERTGRIPAIPETVNYVQKVRAIYGKSAPATTPIVSPAMDAAAPSPEPTRIYKMVDARGVVHFSNIEPPN
jgi:soluble lytic murein transglycosylase-like protein